MSRAEDAQMIEHLRDELARTQEQLRVLTADVNHNLKSWVSFLESQTKHVCAGLDEVKIRAVRTDDWLAGIERRLDRMDAP